MTVYLDTSFLVSALTTDALTPRAHAYLRTMDRRVLVSDWTTAEFCSALANQPTVRGRKASEAFDAMDLWVGRLTERVPVVARDIEMAETIIRGQDTRLRTPDALHVAIAQRLGAELVTFDKVMSDAARNQGVAVAAI